MKIKLPLLKLKFKTQLKKLIGKKVMLHDIALAMLPANANIIEAGAHTGWDTVNLAKLTTGTIYAFEPVPYLYNQLKLRTQGISNISTFQTALGKSAGSFQMYVSSGGSDASSSLLKPKEHINTNPNVLFQETITVSVQTADEWAKENKVKPVHFMWLDMQGAELDMLKSAVSVLQNVELIYTEVSNLELYENQATYNDLKLWLETNGFKVHAEELTWVHTGNVLFKKQH